jgi:hypothetical protein
VGDSPLSAFTAILEVRNIVMGITIIEQIGIVAGIVIEVSGFMYSFVKFWYNEGKEAEAKKDNR